MTFCGKCVLEFFGAVVLAVIALKVFRFIRVNFLVKTNLKAKYGKAGDWAVVTGASQGIGEAYCIELAKRGFNVVAIARRKEVLNDLCVDLESKFKIQAKPIAFDFATTSDADYQALFKQLSSLNVSILVNNVGLSYPSYQKFGTAITAAEEVNILNVNCQSVLRLTHALLPNMREKKAGAVITVSSTYGTMPAPYLGAYGGTKAFGKHFSYSMGVENAEFGIDFQAVSPMFVFTPMAKAKKPTALMVMPREVASGSLDRLGHCFETIGSVKQELLVAVLSLLPDFIADSMSLNQSKDLHKKWVKKQEREAAEAAAAAKK
jgi:17beta-estradiol 17-dehydrogenase / very-long-chain 3-oxoacyl-CoA reductase